MSSPPPVNPKPSPPPEPLPAPEMGPKVLEVPDRPSIPDPPGTPPQSAPGQGGYVPKDDATVQLRGDRPPRPRSPSPPRPKRHCTINIGSGYKVILIMFPIGDPPPTPPPSPPRNKAELNCVSLYEDKVGHVRIRGDPKPDWSGNPTEVGVC